MKSAAACVDLCLCVLGEAQVIKVTRGLSSKVAAVTGNKLWVKGQKAGSLRLSPATTASPQRHWSIFLSNFWR